MNEKKQKIVKNMLNVSMAVFVLLYSSRVGYLFTTQNFLKVHARIWGNNIRK